MKTAYPFPNDDHRSGGWLLTTAVVLAAAGGAFALYKLLQSKAGAPVPSTPPVPPAPPTTTPTPPTTPPAPPTTTPAPPTTPEPSMPPVPSAPPTPTTTALDLLKQELATTPEFEKRIALAAKYFGVDLGRRGYPAYGGIGGINGYTVDGFISAVNNAVSSYNATHKLNWDFQPADILAVENSLLLNVRIVATSAGPSLPMYVGDSIQAGKRGKL